jgi:uncharacterized protein (TIGR00255 family)
LKITENFFTIWPLTVRITKRYRMLRSMTAFSRVKKSFKDIEITVELQSQNKRHLDVQLKLAPELLTFDADIRKVIAEHIARGSLSVSVQANFLKNHPAAVSFNTALAKKIVDAVSGFASDVGYKNLSFQDIFSILFREKAILQISSELENAEYYQGLIEETLLVCLDKLMKMKQREGKLLRDEFKARLKKLEKLIGEIGKRAKGATNKLRKKLTDVLQEFAQKKDVASDERLLKEIALYAERVDIAEELSRFQHHLAHFQEILNNDKDKEPSGKILEFILQELQREINTITSKSQDAEIATLVIDAKSEIEKIREQVQNVE